MPDSPDHSAAFAARGPLYTGLYFNILWMRRTLKDYPNGKCPACQAHDVRKGLWCNEHFYADLAYQFGRRGLPALVGR